MSFLNMCTPKTKSQNRKSVCDHHLNVHDFFCDPELPIRILSRDEINSIQSDAYIT